MKPHITLTTRDALLNGELALLRSQWEMTFTGPDGKLVQIAHRSTEVVRLQKDGRWLYVIDTPFGGD
jgi:ketosteroid isomerase-like protein